MTRRKLLKDEIVLIPREVIEVFEVFEKADKEIYLVGGGVRSLLKGHPPSECDFTTNANPEEIQEITKKWDPFYNNEFGTVGINVETQGVKEKYEITPYRTEKGYSDRRRPDEVVWGKSLEEDIKRRDFTMNAMVVGKDGGEYVILDYLGGIEDFENGLIRSVGDANLRFQEDALRMMRALRFGAVHNFKIEPKTLLGIKENAGLLSEISKERVREELMKILGSEHPSGGVSVMVETKLMENIIPEVLTCIGVWQTGHHNLDVYNHMLEALNNCPSSDPVVRLATWLHDIGKPRSKRLRCSKCGALLAERDKAEQGESPVSTWYVCFKCQNRQNEHQSGTFYGHEVVGARMVEEIMERLKFPRKETEKVVTLVRWHMFTYSPEMTDASIRRFIRRIGKENINDMILLRIGDRKGGGSKTTSWRLMEMQRRIGEQLFEPMEVKDMVVNGKDVMETLGIEPGPKIGEVLSKLFEEVIEDTSKNEREYLLKRVRELA